MKQGVWIAVALAAGVASADPATKPSHGAKRIAIDYTYQSFHHNESHYTIEWRDGAYHAGKRTVAPAVIDALYASLTDLREADGLLRCFSHTDDYPRFTVAIDGDEPLQVSADSNCHSHVPWNVTRNGKQLAQFNGKAEPAVRALLAAVDPDHWKVPPDRPEAFTGMGMEIVGLGAYGERGSPSPSAAACAHDLEASPRAREVFGAAPSVTELQLMCDLMTTADCTAVVASATFVWRGVEANLELPCPKGTVELSAATAARLAELRTFLDSRPVKLLVRLAGKPPRLWNHGRWRMEPMDRDLPQLEFTPGRPVIEVRSIGEQGPSGVSFWKELGLDAAKLTHREGDAFYETIANVDFSGRLVK